MAIKSGVFGDVSAGVSAGLLRELCWGHVVFVDGEVDELALGSA